MRKRVIIDTDPGVDDALALVLALLSPELCVEAITTVNGNVNAGQALKNAALILDLLHPSPRPILARGETRHSTKELKRAQSVHGIDGLGELHRFRNPDGSPRYQEPSLSKYIPSAIEVLLDLLRRYPDEMSLIALGPLTNLAEALEKDKRRVKRLREVVIMGGAIKVPGNITPAAEFNVFVDPGAARRVCNSGLPITLVPLDVTEKVLLGQRDREDIAQSMGESLGTFLRDVTEKPIEYMEQVRGLSAIHLHDPLAVGVAIDPTIVKTTPLHVDVVTHRGIAHGMTLADTRPIRDDLKRPPNLRVALEVEAERFISSFKERLCHGSW
jgi:inosine-uridine nucleoside N-ribohydrolase